MVAEFKWSGAPHWEKTQTQLLVEHALLRNAIGYAINLLERDRQLDHDEIHSLVSRLKLAMEGKRSG